LIIIYEPLFEPYIYLGTGLMRCSWAVRIMVRGVLEICTKSKQAYWSGD